MYFFPEASHEELSSLQKNGKRSKKAREIKHNDQKFGDRVGYVDKFSTNNLASTWCLQFLTNRVNKQRRLSLEQYDWILESWRHRYEKFFAHE